MGVGETGLDYFKEYSPRRDQIENFHWHLDLARRLDKPVVIHCRDAHEDTARIVKEFEGVRGVMHCYTFGPRELEPYLEAGLFISFSGVVTFPKNEDNREAVRWYRKSAEQGYPKAQHNLGLMYDTGRGVPQ